MFGIDPTLLNVVLNIIATLCAGGLVGVFLAHKRGMRELLNADKKDIRDHYDAELKRVTDRLAKAEDRQRECEERETALRERVGDLEDEVSGLKRQIVRYSAQQVVLLDAADGREMSSEVVNAAKRVRKMVKASREHQPEDSDLLSSAKDTVHDNRQALQSSKDTCSEVERKEHGEGK